MRNSTRRGSSKNVKGILFVNRDYKPVYITVQAWLKAGRPSDCFVYDSVHHLLSVGIPVQDAVEVEGRWIRTPLLQNCTDTIHVRSLLTDKRRVKASAIALKETRFITSTESKGRKIR